MYLGLWAVRASHCTATLSSGGICGLYGLRFMHRLNIFLSRSGPRAGRASFLLLAYLNPNPKKENNKWLILRIIFQRKRIKNLSGVWYVYEVYDFLVPFAVNIRDIWPCF